MTNGGAPERRRRAGRVSLRWLRLFCFQALSGFAGRDLPEQLILFLGAGLIPAGGRSSSAAVESAVLAIAAGSEQYPSATARDCVRGAGAVDDAVQISEPIPGDTPINGSVARARVFLLQSGVVWSG
jgi:hypothetical protein